MSTNNNFQPPILVSKTNSQLTSSERETKKRLKAELKFQRKVLAIEKRINHAISRNDPVVERSAREELDALLLSKKESADSTNDDGQLDDQRPQPQQILQSLHPPNDSHRESAINEVVNILRKLLSLIDDKEHEKVRLEKIEQTEKARHLLKNMTKGTQSKSMFQDVTALRGYVRQKFHRRAKLIVDSLGKLSPASLEIAKSLIYNQLNEQQQQQEFMKQIDVMTMCWDKLGSVKTVCSLGCGPGNDAVGIIAFLRSYFNHKDDNIRDIYLLDYAIDEWKQAALDDLIPILMPDFVSKITCEGCDVTKPSFSTNYDIIKKYVRDSDIFLTSYLLTETRKQWHQFIIQLVDMAKVGSLFYFAEPVPWQLHQLIQMATPKPASDANLDLDCSPLERLRFVWLDSSMHRSDFQKLDARCGGPAVLLAIKVS